MTFSLGSLVKPRLGHIILHKGYFYAVAKDRFEVLKLNKKGNQVASIGRRGKGPGEFSTDNLDLTFVGDTLYIYDGKTKRLTLTNENLEILKERYSKDIIFDIFSYKGKVLGLVSSPPKEVSAGNRNINSFRQKLKHSKFKIIDLASEKKVLANFNNKWVNPVYMSKESVSTGDILIIYYSYKNKLMYFTGDKLNFITIPRVESLALGEKVSKQGMLGQLFKDYPYFPKFYSLLRNVIIFHNKIIIQNRSYKKGDQLIFFNSKNRKIIKTVSSPPGKLVGRDSTYFYFYQNKSFNKYTPSELFSCINSHITFYIGAFREQCELCERSFFKIYDWVRQKNIPYNFVIKDNHWFGTVDEDDYRSAVDYMHQWHVWGRLSFDNDCPACFKNGMHVRINGGSLKALPIPVKKIQSAVSCKQ